VPDLNVDCCLMLLVPLGLCRQMVCRIESPLLSAATFICKLFRSPTVI
jgi:hypothetical protein